MVNLVNMRTEKLLSHDPAMSVDELLGYCRDHDIWLTPVSGRLRVSAPTGFLSDKLKIQIKRHRDRLLQKILSPPPGRVEFNQIHMRAIRAGQPVRVWSTVLNEWMLWVRDEDLKRALLADGYSEPIYTVGELAVVSGHDRDTLRFVHAAKKQLGAHVLSGGQH